MVFYVPPKKKLRAHKTILDLPEELLGECFALKHLSRTDVLNARAAHSSLTPTCSEVLQKQLKVLYLHPSPKALKAALNICAHPMFSKGIEEVIMLGRIDWVQLGKAHRRGTRTDGTWDDPKGSRNLACPWPSTMPSDQGPAGPANDILPPNTKALESDRNFIAAHFEAAYQPLIDALGELPKLRKLSFAETVTVPGSNQVTCGTILGTAQKAMVLKAKAERTARMLPTQFADADILIHLLRQPTLQIEHLRLTTELPYVAHPDDDLGSIAPIGYSALDRLKSVELHFDQGWSATKWQLFCAMVLWKARGLERIRVVYKRNPTVTSAVSENSLEKLLMEETWPALQSFEVAFESSPGTLKHTCRPICQRVDLFKFLEQHKATLKRFVLTNVVVGKFGCMSDPLGEIPSPQLGDYSAHDTTRKILTTLSEMPLMEEASFYLPYYHHDAKCWQDTLRGPQCYIRNCGYYCLPATQGYTQVPFTHTDDFNYLAANLGVDLDEEKMGWDFGSWVGKRKQEMLVEE